MFLVNIYLHLLLFRIFTDSEDGLFLGLGYLENGTGIGNREFGNRKIEQYYRLKIIVSKL